MDEFVFVQGVESELVMVIEGVLCLFLVGLVESWGGELYVEIVIEGVFVVLWVYQDFYVLIVELVDYFFDVEFVCWFGGFVVVIGFVSVWFIFQDLGGMFKLLCIDLRGLFLVQGFGVFG